MNKLIYVLILLCFSVQMLSAESARQVSGSKEDISSLPGADMTVYELYLEYRGSDKDKAMDFARTFLDGIDSAAVHPVVAAMADSLSDWYESRKFLFSKAIEYMERSLRIYESLGDEHDAALCKYRLAKLCFRKSFYNLTLKYSTEALESFIKEEDERHVLECYNLLGIVHYVCQDYQVSNDYFRKYAEGARNSADSAQLLLAFNNSAVFTSNIMKDTGKSRQLFRESIKLSREMGDSSYLMSMYINLVNSYLSSGETDKVPALLEKTGAIASDIRQKGQHYYTSGTYYIETGQFRKAQECLNLAIDNFAKGEFDDEMKRCLSALHFAYSRTGDYKDAYETLVKYYDIDDKSVKRSTYLDLFRSQSEMILQKEKEKLDRQRNFLVLGITAGALVLIIVILIVSFNIRKRALVVAQKETALDNIRLKQEKAEQEMKSQAEIVEIRKMQQYQMTRLIEDVVGKMERINSRVQDKSIRNEILAVCNDLRHSKDEGHWKEVGQLVPEFNSAFFQKLLKDFPDLTVNERRLCALLNLNMTTKEISEITKQSVNSINIARGRLRSKLGLTGDSASIQEFLSKYN